MAAAVLRLCQVISTEMDQFMSCMGDHSAHVHMINLIFIEMDAVLMLSELHPVSIKAIDNAYANENNINWDAKEQSIYNGK